MVKNWSISVEKTQQSRLESVDFENLVFGREFSDHMFMVDYEEGEWLNPRIIPFGKLSFYPSMVSLHYGQTVFEGMKAYRNPAGEIQCFRPHLHSERLNASSARLCLPKLPEDLFLQGLYELLQIDSNWIPAKKGCSLYIRPFIIGTDEYIGVAPPKKAQFIIITSPVAAYYSGAVKLLVEEEYVRAAEGGTGFVKMGGNYAASLLPAQKAAEKGYQQLLWTDAKEHKYIEEAGTMNVMFQIGDKIITPNLSTSILPGITRRSVLELAKHWGYEIEERKIAVEEVIEAHKNGTLKDVFGTGTAATITQISHIGYHGHDYELPPVEERDFSVKVGNYLSKLKVGEGEDFMNWMVTI